MLRTTLFVVLIGMFAASMSYAGVVAYWPLDGAGDEALDMSGNGNNGAITGATRVDGRFAGALEFDGVDDIVIVPDSDTLDVSAELTLSFWVIFNDLPEGAWQNVARKEGAYVVEITGDNKIQMNIWAGGNWATGQAYGGPTLEPGVWYFMAGVKLPGAGLEAYLDGELIAEGDKEGDADITTSALHIGAGGPAWMTVDGIIDEITLWDEALSQAEIAAEMEGPASVGHHDKLVTHWGSLKAGY